LTDPLFQLLNLTRKYVNITTQVSDHERFLQVAASNDRDGLGRLVKVAQKNKKGIREIIRRSERAILGLYHVKSFTVRKCCCGYIFLANISTENPF
jgi:hypothetical protein